MHSLARIWEGLDWIWEWMARIWEGMDSGRRPYLDEGPEFLVRSQCERRAGLARSRVQVPMPTPSQSTANCGALRKDAN